MSEKRYKPEPVKNRRLDAKRIELKRRQEKARVTKSLNDSPVKEVEEQELATTTVKL